MRTYQLKDTMSKLNTSIATAKTGKRTYDEDHLWKAEANVDSVIETTRPTLKVTKEVTIGGKVYRVLSI